MAADPFALANPEKTATDPFALEDKSSPEAMAPAARPGPLMAGVRQATAGIRSAGGGLLSMAGRGFGVRGLEDAGNDITARAEADAATNSMRVEDVNDVGSGVDFAKYAIGNLIPYALVTAVLGTGGRAAASMASRKVTEAATREFVKNVGTIAGPAAFSIGTEMGSIYPDAVKEGVKDPIGRSIAGGLAAGLLDTAFPAYLMGKLGVFGSRAGRGPGVRGALESAGKEAVKASALEGSTEFAQTVIERAAAGQPLGNDDAFSAYKNAAAVGAIGGGAIGAPVGALAHAPAAQASPSANDPFAPSAGQAAPVAAPAAPAVEPAARPGGEAPVAGAAGEAQLPLPSLKMVKSEFPTIDPVKLEPATLWGRIDELQGKAQDLGARIQSLNAEAASDTRSRGRTKSKIVAEIAAASSEKAALDRRLGNLNTLASTPDYQRKTGSVDTGVLVNESQQPSSIVTPGKGGIEAVTGAKPGFLNSATDLVELGKIKARAAELEIPVGRTPRETIKAPDLRVAQEQFLERAGRAAETNVQALVDSGIVAPEARRTTQTIIYKSVKDALTQPDAQTAKDTIRAGIEKAVSRKLLKQDVDGFVDRVFADLAGDVAPKASNVAPAATPAAPAAAPAPLKAGDLGTKEQPVTLREGVVGIRRAGEWFVREDRGLGSWAKVTGPQTTAEYNTVAQPLEAPAAASAAPEAAVERPSVLVLGKVGRTPLHAEPLALRTNPQTGGYDLFQGGYPVQDFDTAVNVTYPAEMSTGAILKDVKERQKDLFGAHARFYEEKGKQFHSQAAVDEHLRDVVGETQGRFAAQGRIAIEALSRLLGQPKRLEYVLQPVASNEPVGRTTLRPEKDTIAVATNAKDVLSVAYHEGFHYLEERVLTGAERAVLDRGLQPGTPLFEQVLARAKQYDYENKTDIAAEIQGKPEEAHAYAFEMWKRGELETKGLIQRAFEKLREVIERITNALHGSGFTSVTDIYHAIDAGEYAARTPVDHFADVSFESRAAVLDMSQLMADGQLQPQQLMAESSKFFDGLDLPKPTVKQVLGIGRDSITGSLKRFYLENIASGTFIARDSRGFGNVFATLTAHKQRKDFLISQGVDDMLSKWDGRRGTSQEDIAAVGNALFKRTEGAYRTDSIEYQSLIGTLTAAQRQMLEQANAMVADRLQQEFQADQKTMQGLLGPASPEYAEWLTKRGTKVQQLIDEGYVPERRYGDHVVHVTVTVKDKDGAAKPLTLLREQFETEAEAQARLLQYQGALEGDPAFKPAYEYKYAAQHDGSLSYQQFLDMARRQGIELTQVERERLARAMVSSDSMRNNRIFRRSNVPGYSRDVYRVLSAFAVTMANKIAYSEFSDAINSAALGNVVQSVVKQGVPSISIDRNTDLWSGDGPQAGFYRTIADQRIDYVMQRDPGGDWSRNARAAASMYFLGGSFAAGAVQLSSLPMNTVPYLYQHTGYGNAFAKTLDAFKSTTANFNVLRDIAKLKDTANRMESIDAVPGLRQALIEAAQDGTVLDTEIYHIMGTTRGGMLSKSPRVQKAMEAWMSPFRLAEQMNRYSTFIAAYKVGQENRLNGQELYKFAQETVYNTQFRYDEANRPGLAHNPIWAILFTFKSYPIFMSEMVVTMFRQSPRAGVMMLLSLSAAAGINGLPFAEDLMDLVDTISQRIFGSPFNSKRAIRNVLKSASEAVVGADMSGLVMNGMMNELTGMSFASRVGLGNMIPGTRVFAADADYKRSVEEIVGPVASMVGGAAHGAIALTKGEPLEALRAASPLAVQNVVKSVEQFTKGYATDAAGRKLVDVTSWEAFAQGVGFSSAKLNQAYDLDRIDRQTQAFYKEAQKDFTREIVKAVQSGDAAKVHQAYAGVVEWNKANPDMPMALSGPTLRREIAEAGMPINERTLKMLPRQLRSQSLALEAHTR